MLQFNRQYFKNIDVYKRQSADRKTVVKRLEKGESFDEAVKDFVSDSNFDTWYEATKAELEKVVK